MACTIEGDCSHGLRQHWSIYSLPWYRAVCLATVELYSETVTVTQDYTFTKAAYDLGKATPAVSSGAVPRSFLLVTAGLPSLE